MAKLRIIEVESQKHRKEFIEYPLRLYKDNEYFVPPLYSDEKNLFTDKNTYNSTCLSVFYIAVRGGVTVGRIQGILQKQYNEIHGVKQVRFTRFDCENNQDTANALFDAVVVWAKEHRATEVLGPLGYSDLEREGLLIEGFDYLSTFEEQYNYDYYQTLIENYGFVKDVDWVEYRLYPEVYENEKLKRLGEKALAKFDLHFAGIGMPKKKFIKKYKDGIFECLDECYKELYGVVPFTPEMIKQMVDQFILVLNMKYFFVLCNKDEKVCAFGFGIPGIGKCVQKSGGKLTPLTILKILKEIKRPKTVDLALVGILPQYRNSGLNAIIIAELQRMIVEEGLEYMETNLNLEDNYGVRGQWKYFKNIQHKRRRSYKKQLV